MKLFLYSVMSFFKREPKLKQADFDCPKCGKYYRFKHFKESHKKIDITCKCGAWNTIYVNGNETTNISWWD